MLPVPEPRLESLSMKNILDLWRKGNLLYQIYIGQAIALFAEPDYKTHLNFLDQWSNDLQKIVETTFQARLTDPETYGRYYQLILDFLMGGLVSGMFRFAVVGGDDDITLCYRGLKIAQAIIEGIQDPAQLQVACSHIMMTGLDVRVMTAALCKVHPILNSVAIICLRDMFTRSCVSESLTATELSTLLTICVSCFNLNRTEMAKEQWRAPKSILRQEMEKRYGKASPGNLEIQIMRWLFEYQHLALETALALFEKRSKPMSKKFCLQIIQQSPQVLLTLLNLLCETRPPFHLTLANDGLSARILVHLMALPLGWVPGLDVTSSYIEKTDMEEWDAAIQCNNILWSRPEALQRIITMRTKVCEEDIASITIKLLTSRHSKTKFDDVRSVFRNRGTLLVANLRLLINFTYLDDNPVPFLLALLPFSYWACIRKIKGEAPLGDTETENSIKESVKEEREYEIITSNMAPGNKFGHFVTSYVAPTSVLAPTLLFRVLLRLSKVGYGLENLQTMRTRPPNMPDHAFIGSLVHIHQTVDSKIMGKLIRLSIDRRVSEHRELAKERVLVGGSVENAVAAATYVSAAELALAHIGYGSSSGNRALPVVQQNWRTFAQAKKEVILCLGNAAEAAGRVGKWSMSKKFSTVAVDFCNMVTEDEAKMADCDVQSLKAKNQRRYSFAIQQLQ